MNQSIGEWIRDCVAISRESDVDADEDYYGDQHMDGDHESALASAGMGTDEDYGYYGEDEW